MDHTISFTSDEGDMNWSDSHSMISDEASLEPMLPRSPSPMETAWMNANSTTQLQVDQLPPIGNPMDISMDTSSAPTMDREASSSCTDSWSTGCADRDEVENDRWEQGSDDILAIPKLEPMDDDFDLNDVMAAPLKPVLETVSTQNKQKRPRGRPRKHPLNPLAGTGKVTKGRSKTGCITCRKRKKKCDEAKPRCMNCEKNAVVCEGYHEKQIWKSGKEKAEEERLRRESLPVITMPPIFHGVETTEDRMFWKHYISHFSNILTVEGEAKNAFKDIILQLANKHKGLMHSILAVSGNHLELDTPYGAKLMAENPSATPEKLQERSEYHHEQAIKHLYEDMKRPMDREDSEYKTILSARYGQMLCLLLQTRAEGNPRGEHRVHLQAYQSLIQTSPPEDPAFHTFITEFFEYHIFADDLFWHPEMDKNRLAIEDWQPSFEIHPPRLIGVADGLFRWLTQITNIRNIVRSNMAASIDPLVDYGSLYQAAQIDIALREWEPRWPPGDNRDRVSLLYKQMLWIHLFRTIYPPTVPSMRRSTFSTFPGPTKSSILAPQRRASMAATVSTVKVPLGKSLLGAQVTQSCPSSRNVSRTNSMDERNPRSMNNIGRDSSPPPSRRPADHDQRLLVAVEESLGIIDSFKTSDPVQPLLLIPCVLIGTCCFNSGQRDRIRAAIKTVRGYTGMRSADRALEVLEEVWALVEQGDWVSVWDWQSVARRMNIDFICV